MIIYAGKSSTGDYYDHKRPSFSSRGGELGAAPGRMRLKIRRLHVDFAYNHPITIKHVDTRPGAAAPDQGATETTNEGKTT